MHEQSQANPLRICSEAIKSDSSVAPPWKSEERLFCRGRNRTTPLPLPIFADNLISSWRRPSTFGASFERRYKTQHRRPFSSLPLTLFFQPLWSLLEEAKV